MAQYKVLKRFRLLDDVNVQDVGPIQEVGQVIDIQVKRADQVIKKLGGSFLERIVDQEDNEDDKESTEETTDEEGAE